MIQTRSKEFTHLDFKNYKHIIHGYLLMPTPDEKYKYLAGLYDRVCSIIYFSSNIGGESNRTCIRSRPLSAAMFRASLTEFIALDDYVYNIYGQRI